jgi:hypothetical protein
MERQIFSKDQRGFGGISPPKLPLARAAFFKESTQKFTSRRKSFHSVHIFLDPPTVSHSHCPTDSIVCITKPRWSKNRLANHIGNKNASHNKGRSSVNDHHLCQIEVGLTKGEAVGPSRIASSSSVKGMRGTRSVRRGISNMIITGNPIAAVEQTKEDAGETI